MGSWIDLANSALIKIGVRPIMDFTDATKEARLVRNRYVQARQIVLRMHDWNCAKTAIQPAANPAQPITQKYQYAYPLPGDFMRLIDVWSNGQKGFPYEVYGGRTVLTDWSPIQIEYVQDVIDPTRLDPLLFEAMAYYLAYDIVYSITQSGTGRDEMYKLFKEFLSKAKLANAQENSNLQLQAEDWINSRLAGPTVTAQDSISQTDEAKS